jgi:hypothetical protein
VRVSVSSGGSPMKGRAPTGAVGHGETSLPASLAWATVYWHSGHGR